MIGKNFTIEAQVAECNWKKRYFGTESGAYIEAMDLMNDLIMRYINDNHITDPNEQDTIINNATNTIVWEDSESPILCYTVISTSDSDPLGVYYTEADAQEAIFSECEGWVEEIMMQEDPYEVVGREWDWHDDYYYLLSDAGKDFIIKVVPVFDLEDGSYV